MAEMISHSTVLHMRDFGDLLVTRDQGEIARANLMRLLQDHPQVDVVLDGVDAYTPSFIDEVLGKCMAAMGPAEFRRAVRLIASAPEVRKLVNLVLSNRCGKRLS
jgi:hypothetical protein